jgi:RNA polymerase sigma-70 factor (ECF subfamily)
MQNTLANDFFACACAKKGNLRVLDMQSALLGIIGVMKRFLDSDARLVRAILADDKAAWQKFILQYSNFIYSAIVKYTDDYDEKMAVYLHVLEKLREDRFKRLRQFAFKAKLSTWLTVVSRRLAIDFLRGKYGRDFGLKKVRVVSIDGEPGYAKILAGTTTPETEMAADERRAHQRKLEDELRLALDRLDDRERLAVQMVYFQGMRIKEVGRLLRLPAAYKFVARSLKKIRAEIDLASRLSRAEIRDVLEGEAHE